MDWHCHTGARAKHATVDQRCLPLSTTVRQRCAVQYPLGCGRDRDRDDLLCLASVVRGGSAVNGGARGCVVFRIPVRVCPSYPLNPLLPLVEEGGWGVMKPETGDGTQGLATAPHPPAPSPTRVEIESLKCRALPRIHHVSFTESPRQLLTTQTGRRSECASLPVPFYLRNLLLRRCNDWQIDPMIFCSQWQQCRRW